MNVAARWTYLYRAVDQHGQVIDVLLCTRRNAKAARAFFTRALTLATTPVAVITDRAPVHPRVVDKFAPQARRVLDRYANNVVEADHGRLKGRLRPCVDSNAWPQLKRSRLGARSCRTYAAATTSSPPTRRPAIVSASRSTNSRTASDSTPRRHRDPVDRPTIG